MNDTQPATVEDRLREVDRVLDEYERSLGMPPFPVETPAREYMSLTREQLRAMSAVDCAEAAALLLDYAGHLQRALNREQARVTWARESVRKMVAPQLPQQKGGYFEERLLHAVRGNDAASKVDSLRVKAQLRVDRVSYLAESVRAKAKALTDLYYAKRGQRD